MHTSPEAVISTILKHDDKQTSYKIALLRAINDVVLNFPDLHTQYLPIAVPLRILAEFWLAYYWPFVDPTSPILQGPRAVRKGQLRNDMTFRPELTEFRRMWQAHWGGISNPADGFRIVDELHVPRIRATYPPALLKQYAETLKKIARTIQIPVRYAGPDEWTIFSKPRRLRDLRAVVPIPGTHAKDLCVVIDSALWQAFQKLSLWVEALCIHEWCLFSERVNQHSERLIDRGFIYMLLTARPDNRRPLTWERNQVDLLILEGHNFVCPWTEKRIVRPGQYDLDHLVPVSIYPINELWNLVPSDPDFNSHKKRDRLPTRQSLERAQPHLMRTYATYEVSKDLATALHQDVAVRFAMPAMSHDLDRKRVCPARTTTNL